MSTVDGAPLQPRPSRPEDEPGLLRLFARSFDRATDASTRRWKLQMRPTPSDNSWVTVDEAGTPIFHYGGIPRTLQLPGGARPAMVAVDGMTDPSHRRQGLLTAGVTAAHDAWRQAGIAFVLGLPNRQWGSRTAALDWHPLFPLRWMIRPLCPEHTLARKLRLPLGRLQALTWLWELPWRLTLRPDPTLTITPLERATDELDTLWEDCRGWWFALRRGRDWVHWRYLTCPHHHYRVLLARRDGRATGYLAYRLDNQGPSPFGFLAELTAAAHDRATHRTLLAAALRDLRAQGATAVATLAIPHSPLAALFRRSGFLFSWGSFTVHGVLLANDLSIETLRDPRHWALAGGDFDVI